MGWFGILKKDNHSWFDILKLRIPSPPPRISNGEIDYAKHFKDITPRIELAILMHTNLMKHYPDSKIFHQECLSLIQKYKNTLHNLIEPQKSLTQQVGGTEDPETELRKLGKPPKLSNGKADLRTYMKKIYPRLNHATAVHDEAVRFDDRNKLHSAAVQQIIKYAMKLKQKTKDNEAGVDMSHVGRRPEREEDKEEA